MRTAAEQRDLAEALAVRRQNIGSRTAAVMVTGVLLYLGMGWTWLWAWMALYAVFQSVEHFATDHFEKGQGEGRSPNPALAAVVVAAWLYAGLAIPLTFAGGDGEVIAIVVLAGGLVNSLIVSRASLTFFFVSAGPYAVCLIGLPVFELARGADTAGEAAVLATSSLLILYTLTAWVILRRTLRSEALARAESEDGRREAEFARDAKSAFVAMVSHELRTPLSGIIAIAAQLQARPHNAAEHEAVEVLVDSGQFMKTLLDDLLDLAKLEAGPAAARRWR